MTKAAREIAAMPPAILVATVALAALAVAGYALYVVSKTL
jgi:hypothetical protein